MCRHHKPPQLVLIKDSYIIENILAMISQERISHQAKLSYWITPTFKQSM
nr:MAG TPA: hypothetical protein [Caudoviricetes sp.]